MGEREDREQEPLQNALASITLIFASVVGFFCLVEWWADKEAKGARERGDEFIRSHGGKVERAVGKKEEPEGWPEKWDLEKMMESSFESAMDNYETGLKEGGLSLDGKKFWPEKIERSVQETTGKRRTVVFTVTAEDKAGCSLGFTVEVVATFEYWEKRGDRKGFFVQALGKPDSYGWEIVKQWGASRKKEIPRKFKCCDSGETGSLLREKPFPHKRGRTGAPSMPKRNLHGKMRRHA